MIVIWTLKVKNTTIQILVAQNKDALKNVCMWALLPSAAALRSERVRCPRSAHWPD